MKTQNSTDTRPEASTGSSAWRLVKRAAGYLLAMACLVWVFHDIHVERLFREMTSIRWGIIPLAVIADALGYCSQGVRWRLLLRPVGRISAWRTTQAVYAGLFTSEVLPLRAGELVRGFLVSRWLSVRLISIIPSMVVERLLDGVWLALGIGLAALAVQLPRSIIVAADVLGTVVLLGTVLFMYLVLHRRRPPAEKPSRAIATWRPVRLLVTFIDRIAGGMRSIGAGRSFYLAFLISSGVLVFQIVAFWLVMLAYGLSVSLWIGAATLLIVHIGIIIPNAPSNVGTYQFFCVIGLSLFGVDKTTATGFSVAVFIILTLPLWAIGLVAISKSGMKLREIHSEISRLMGRRADK